MPLELGIWRIDSGLEPVEFKPLDVESRLEDMLDRDIGIAGPNWMVIGRQVRTSFDKIIDLLAIDSAGNLVVLELKRDKTYRDAVAQVLDYGSWVRELRDEQIAQTFQDYLKKYHPEREAVSIDDAFREHFSVANIPDELNSSHELVIVASSLDPSTERVVTYLTDEHGVSINAVFFQVFRDGDREYLCRAWLREPGASAVEPSEDKVKGEWNGEYYVSFSGSRNRDWDEAVQYGFVSGGGGPWYSRTLALLEEEARVWVNVPGTGYVGVGKVVEPMVPVEKFEVSDESGKRVSIVELPLKIASTTKFSENQEKAEYLVRVDWIKTVPVREAVKEKGFFGNQNTVARPTTQSWVHTIDRLKKRFGVS